MKIKAVDRLQGDVSLPGDKSISHRAAMMAALTEGKVRIDNFAASVDCGSTLKCLEELGIEIEREGNTVFVAGKGKTGFIRPESPLDCGNSGTTMRLLSGILGGQGFESVLIGDESLSRRPMSRIIKPLGLMGAEIESDENHAPLRIHGKNPLHSIVYDSPVASAQIKSCVLLAGLNAEGKTSIKSPKTARKYASSRDHTELMMKYLGAEIEESFIEIEGGFQHQVTISGDSLLTARDLNVPSDVSSAAFFLVAASCLNGSELILRNVGLNPTRTAVIDVLKELGAEIEVLDQKLVCNEIVGDLRVSRKAELIPLTAANIVKGDRIANLIDEIPILAIFGTQLEDGLEIRDAEELRVKESDRIKAVVENLRRMKADIEEFSDGFRVGKSNLKGAEIEVFHDHRIAMAFAVAGLLAEGETTINGAEWAAVSFPGFFETLFSIAK